MKYVMGTFLLLICVSSAWADDRGQQQVLLLAKSIYDRNEQLDLAIQDLRQVLPNVKEDTELFPAEIIFVGTAQQASMAMKNHNSWLATYSAMKNNKDKEFVLEELRYSLKVSVDAVERAISQINKALPSLKNHELAASLVRLREVLTGESQLLASWKP